MSLPRFFSRVSDSISPLLQAELSLESYLAEKSVRLEAPADIEQNPSHVAGLLLLVNLCARLYPRIQIDASPRIFEECRSLALAINPMCEVSESDSQVDPSAVLSWARAGRSPNSIAIAPMGWEVVIDLPEANRVHPTNILTSLSAAAIGASELFRQVFGSFLGKGRSIASPGRFNILTHAPTSTELPDLPSDINLGRVHLVGAGAVGQAAAYALARVSARGTIVVVDPEAITESNLQRYVLTTDRDVGASKCDLITRAFARTKRLETISVEGIWSLSDPLLRDAEYLCAAVDSEAVRIALQASLPFHVFNAWTQPDDIGWSRHERFGEEPCLACLYWPTRPRPNYHENVAKALKESELRVLSYLMSKLSVDVPLPASQILKLPQYPVPPNADEWSQRSLLEDVARRLGVPDVELGQWKGRSLPDLYRDGICAGALVKEQGVEVPSEMAVPLAHQSAMAGIMLATQLLVSRNPELRQYRSPSVENRLDLLAGFPQISARPRQRTIGCLCGDSDFVAAYVAKWSKATNTASSSD